MKRRLALLALIAAANVVVPVLAREDGGNCKACGEIEVEGQIYEICVGNLSHGYRNCAGGFGTSIPCVNSPWTCAPIE